MSTARKETDHQSTKTLGKIFYPRTNRDFARITELVAQGFSNVEILKKLENPLWRTDLVDFRGELFCATCDSVIAPNWCSECGEPEWPWGKK